MPDSLKPRPQTDTQDDQDEVRPPSPVDFRPQHATALLTALVVMATMACLYLASAVFMPITLAILFAIVLSPVVRALRTIGVPESLGAAIVLVTLIGILGFGVYRLGAPAADWLHQLPQHLGEAQKRLRGILQPLEAMRQAGESVASLTQGAQHHGQAATGVQQDGSAGFAVSRTAEALISLGATIVLTFFLLTTRDLFLRKLVQVLPRLQDKKLAVGIALQIQQDMSGYLFTITAINVGLGVVIGCVLWGFGLPTPVLWGGMVTLFNFVPYLGPIASFGLIALVSLLSTQDFWHVLLPPLSFLVVTVIEGNIFTPWLVARRLTLNTVAVFVSILFWGWMWGIPGTFMAVPLLAIFKILCDHIEPLKPAGNFLGA